MQTQHEHAHTPAGGVLLLLLLLLVVAVNNVVVIVGVTDVIDADVLGSDRGLPVVVAGAHTAALRSH
jgi:hypothetical protein